MKNVSPLKAIIVGMITLFFLFFFLLPRLSFDITPTVRASIPLLLPQTAQSLEFSQARLRGDLSLILTDFRYTPDPPLEFKAASIQIKLSLWKILWGKLQLLHISSSHLSVQIPVTPPWLNSRHWPDKQSELISRKEWISLLSSEWEVEELYLRLPKVSLTFENFFAQHRFAHSNGLVHTSWKRAISDQIPNLYEGHLQLTFAQFLKGEFKTESSLGTISGTLTSSQPLQVSGEMQYKGNLAKLSRWLFEPQTDLKGPLSGQLHWKTHLLYPLRDFQAKGSVQGNHWILKGLDVQNSTVIQQFAPQFKTLPLSHFSTLISVNPQQIRFDSLQASNSQLDFAGRLRSNWKGQFDAQLDFTLSPQSTNQLPAITRQNLSIENDGRAHFSLHLTGTPTQHSISNLGELTAHAVKNNLRALGDKILDFFK